MQLDIVLNRYNMADLKVVQFSNIMIKSILSKSLSHANTLCMYVDRDYIFFSFIFNTIIISRKKFCGTENYDNRSRYRFHFFSPVVLLDNIDTCYLCNCIYVSTRIILRFES